MHKALVNNDADVWAKTSEDGFAGIIGRPGHDDWCTPGGHEMQAIVERLWNPEEFECAWVSDDGSYGQVRKRAQHD